MVVEFQIVVSGSWHHVFCKVVTTVLDETGAIILSVKGASEKCC